MGLFSGLLGGLRRRNHALLLDSLDIVRGSPGSSILSPTEPATLRRIGALRTRFTGDADATADWRMGLAQADAFRRLDSGGAGLHPRNPQYGISEPWRSILPLARAKAESAIEQGSGRDQGPAVGPRALYPTPPAQGRAGEMGLPFISGAEAGLPARAGAIQPDWKLAVRDMRSVSRDGRLPPASAPFAGLASPNRSGADSRIDVGARTGQIEPPLSATSVGGRADPSAPMVNRQDRLPKPDALPPEIARDIEEWNKNDLGWEELLQHKSQDALKNGKAKWQRQEEQARARVDAARRELADAQSRQVHPGRIDQLQRRVDSLARSARIGRVARQEAAIQANAPKIAALRAVSERLTRYAHGKSVRLRPHGGPEESYTIRGPGAAFDSPEAAARDGIALSYFVTSLTRDPHERGGRIIALGGGKYTYEQLDVGTYPRSDMVIGGEPVDKGLPFARLSLKPDMVGYFHIHPNNSRLIKKDNTRFSSHDENSYLRAAKLNKNIETYLGGSDGSLTMMRGGKIKPFVLQPPGYFPVPRTR